MSTEVTNKVSDKAIVSSIVSRSNQLNQETKRALFDIARVREEEYQVALTAAKQALDARTDAIRNILALGGPGPYLVDGKEVRIVVRPIKDADKKVIGETIFFRQLNIKDVESV